MQGNESELVAPRGEEEEEEEEGTEEVKKEQ